jgi:hypothetical protein
MAERSPDRPSDRPTPQRRRGPDGARRPRPDAGARTPARREPAEAEQAPEQTPEEAAEALATRPTPLTERWWWTGGSLALVGVVVIVWQWSSISAGESVWGNWAVAALGAVAVVVGGIWVWRDRPKGDPGAGG